MSVLFRKYYNSSKEAREQALIYERQGYSVTVSKAMGQPWEAYGQWCVSVRRS